MSAIIQLREISVQTEKPVAKYATYQSELNIVWLLGSAKRALQKAHYGKETIDAMVNECLGSAYPQSEHCLSKYVEWDYGTRKSLTPSYDDEGNIQKATIVFGTYFIGDIDMLPNEFVDTMYEASSGFEKLAQVLIDGDYIVIFVPLSGEMKTNKGDEFEFNTGVFIVSDCEKLNVSRIQAKFFITREIEIFRSDEEDGRYMVIGDVEFDSDYQNRCEYCDEKYCDGFCIENDESSESEDDYDAEWDNDNDN